MLTFNPWILFAADIIKNYLVQRQIFLNDLLNVNKKDTKFLLSLSGCFSQINPGLFV